MIDIKVPTVGESISEVTLLKWNKKDGEYVERDEARILTNMNGSPVFLWVGRLHIHIDPLI